MQLQIHETLYLMFAIHWQLYIIENSDSTLQSTRLLCNIYLFNDFDAQYSILCPIIYELVSDEVSKVRAHHRLRPMVTADRLASVVIMTSLQPKTSACLKKMCI